MKNKRINIYGIPGSGTKLVQLYACLTILQKYEKCYINYEPFLWESRYCMVPSLEGIKEHLRLPLYISNIHDYESKYLQRITKPSNHPIVSKFVMGNGRIAFINKETHADKTIVIIRDIQEVLNSGNIYLKYALEEGKNIINDELRLQKEIRAYNDKDLVYWMDNVSIKGEALYWYFMNKIALDYITGKDILFTEFKDIRKKPNEELEKIADYLDMDKPLLDFNNITSQVLHNNSLICTVGYNSSSIYTIFQPNPELIQVNLGFTLTSKKHKIKTLDPLFNQPIYAEMQKELSDHPFFRRVKK